MWPNRAKYVGNFVNDQMTGGSASRLEYGDGSVYFGLLKDNKRNDQEGTFNFTDGSKFVGAWLNDK
jgi:hypothetical protein